jgi:hypothetical protein
MHVYGIRDQFIFNDDSLIIDTTLQSIFGLSLSPKVYDPGKERPQLSRSFKADIFGHFRLSAEIFPENGLPALFRKLLHMRPRPRITWNGFQQMPRLPYRRLPERNPLQNFRSEGPDQLTYGGRCPLVHINF